MHWFHIIYVQIQFCSWKGPVFFPGSETVGYANGLLTDWRQNCHFPTQSNRDNQRMIHCVTRRRISGSFNMNLISMQGCATREVHEHGGTNWQWPLRENSEASGGELQMKVVLVISTCNCDTFARSWTIVWVIVRGRCKIKKIKKWNMYQFGRTPQMIFFSS